MVTAPLTALAPMQDVTTLAFMRVIADFGAPDVFFTEYFRVHGNSQPSKFILESIINNPSDRPIYAQLIGEDIPSLGRTAKELQSYPIAGIDLNLGCPAPKLYCKNVGGGLLREPAKVDRILGALREACPTHFTVKMRIGFDDRCHYRELLQLINKHSVDILSVHGRTVKEMYRGGVHYDCIKEAVNTVKCPVFANGNITSVEKAKVVVKDTGASGLMVGRSAIRNPWLFRQLRECFAGEAIFQPTLQDVYAYIERLWEATYAISKHKKNHVAYMKKFLNFIGQSVDAEGRFLYKIRRSREMEDFFNICRDYLVEGGNGELPFPPEPYPKVKARPNHGD